MGIIDEKASGALSSVLQSLPDIMNVVLFEKVKTTTVLEIAKDSRLTFYDASYIAMAKDRNEPLVTEDVHLAKAASKMGMRTYTTTHLFGSESTKNAQG